MLATAQWQTETCLLSWVPDCEYSMWERNMSAIFLLLGGRIHIILFCFYACSKASFPTIQRAVVVWHLGSQPWTALEMLVWRAGDILGWQWRWKPCWKRADRLLFLPPLQLDISSCPRKDGSPTSQSGDRGAFGSLSGGEKCLSADMFSMYYGKIGTSCNS